MERDWTELAIVLILALIVATSFFALVEMERREK